MEKREIVAAIVGLIVVAGLIATGLWWKGHPRHSYVDTSASSIGSSNQSVGNSGGINLDDSGASSLGQLGGNQAEGSDDGGSSGNSSASDGVNPTLFSQYNKYKSHTTALFAEIKKGTGAQLTPGHTAVIYYKGWLTNGTLIDQSPVSASGQPQPYRFRLGAHQVILGLEEGINGMKVGGKRLLIVPPAVGYGSQGQGAVPPNAVIIFDIQLLKVQ